MSNVYLFSGASAHKPCIFPFKFNGVTYNGCTWVSSHLTEHKVGVIISPSIYDFITQFHAGWVENYSNNQR